MHPELWHSVEVLFHAAMERSPAERADFLREQCAHSPELLSEVQSLITAAEAANGDGDYNIRPASAAHLRYSTALWPGERFGRYEVVRELGKGGMATVYLARDHRLGRRVALKVIRADAVPSREQIARFEREARMAGAIHHPNLVVTYDAGEIDGHLYLSCEYVEGRTLRDHLGDSPLPIDDALRLASQIAAGLAAIHAAGIIHRDLKPENVMVQADGTVRLLDFGIAKRALSEGTAPDVTGSYSTAPVGTLLYMSPEQFAGTSVGFPSDLWSFGVILYELLTARHPFASATPVQAVANIRAGRYPPLAGHPRCVTTLVTSLLSLAPQDRGASAEVVRARLARCHSRLSAQYRPVATPWVVAGAIALLMSTGASYLWLAPKLRADPSWEVTRLSGQGQARYVTAAPDGRFIAYVGDSGSGQALYLRQMATQTDLKLLSAGLGRSFTGIDFAPAGDYIYYTLTDKEQMGTLFRVPSIGGESRPLVRDVDGEPALSPDGRQVAFVRHSPSDSAVFVAGADGDEVRKVRTHPLSAMFTGPLAWSANGSTILAASLSGDRTGVVLASVHSTTGAERPFNSHVWRTVTALHASGSELFGIVSEHLYDPLHIVQLRENGGIAPVTSDAARYESLSGTANGRLFAVERQRHTALWVSPTTAPEEIRQVTSGQSRYVGASWLSADVLLTIDTSGRVPEALELDVRTGTARRALQHKGIVEALRGCGDGRRTIWNSNASGDWRIWLQDATSGKLRVLTHGPGTDSAPTCSPKSPWIVFQTTSTGRATLAKVNETTGETHRLTSEVSYYPELSPDGSMVACTYLGGESHALGAVAILAADEGKVIRRLRNVPPDLSLRWTPDGSRIAFVQTVNSVSNIWVVGLDDVSPEQLTHFREGRIFGFAWSPDGSRLAVVRGTETRDLIVLQKGDGR